MIYSLIIFYKVYLYYNNLFIYLNLNHFLILFVIFSKFNTNIYIFKNFKEWIFFKDTIEYQIIKYK